MTEVCPPIRPRGFWGSLTPEQQQAALAYRGPESHGEVEYRIDPSRVIEAINSPPRLYGVPNERFWDRWWGSILFFAIGVGILATAFLGSA